MRLSVIERPAVQNMKPYMQTIMATVVGASTILGNIFSNEYFITGALSADQQKPILQKVDQ